MKSKRQSRKEEIYSLIPTWKESSLSVRQFCKEQGISEHTFRYWYKRYGISEIDKKSRIAEGCFVPVQILGGQSDRETEKIEIEYPNGVGLILPVKTNLRIIKNLIKLY